MNLPVWLPTLLSPPCLAPKKLQTHSPPVSPIISCPFQLLLLYAPLTCTPPFIALLPPLTPTNLLIHSSFVTSSALSHEHTRAWLMFYVLLPQLVQLAQARPHDAMHLLSIYCNSMDIVCGSACTKKTKLSKG